MGVVVRVACDAQYVKFKPNIRMASLGNTWLFARLEFEAQSQIFSHKAF